MALVFCEAVIVASGNGGYLGGVRSGLRIENTHISMREDAVVTERLSDVIYKGVRLAYLVGLKEKVQL